LLGFEEQVYFAPAFFYHPPGTGDVVAAAVRRFKAEGATPEEIMDACSRLRIRCDRYGHVSAERVYATGTLDTVV
jgi:hypothetical protein